jgi:hypothetical protein
MTTWEHPIRKSRPETRFHFRSQHLLDASFKRLQPDRSARSAFVLHRRVAKSSSTPPRTFENSTFLRTRRKMSEHKRPRVFLDVEVNGYSAGQLRKRETTLPKLIGDLQGRIVIELFDDIVPKTAENFKQLCTWKQGRLCSMSREGHFVDARPGGPTTPEGKPLSYKGSSFHRLAYSLFAWSKLMLSSGSSSASVRFTS